MVDVMRARLGGSMQWWRDLQPHQRVSTGALTLSVVLLIIVICAATLAWPLPLLSLALILYLLCSLVRAVVQFWFENVLPGWAFLIGCVLIGLGLITALFWLRTKADALPIIFVVLIYAGLGWVVHWLRHQTTILGWGKWIFVIGALTLAGSSLWVTQASGWLYVVLLGFIAIALLLIVPIGLNLMSEAALWHLAKRAPWKVSVPVFGLRHVDTKRATLAAIAAGTVLPLIAIVVVAIFGHSWTPVLIATGVALVLMVAIASDSHLDIALVIAALVLVSSAPPQVDEPEWLDHGTGTSALIAMGDSYMSGEGASRFYTGTDDGGKNECRRAPTAYAVRAGKEGGHFDAVTFLACSGARTYNVIGSKDGKGTEVQTGEPATQVDQLQDILTKNRQFRPKLVLVSVGGNDAGFATIGETCLSAGNCDTQEPLFEGNLPAVHDALLTTFASIRSALPTVPIVAVPYPQPIMLETSCNGLPLSKSEREFISRLVFKLDDAVSRAAAEAGVWYLDTMQGALASQHLQLCDPQNHGHPGINQVMLRSVGGLASQRFSPAKWIHNSLHPNERGHGAMLQTFNAWLDDHPNLAPRVPTKPGSSDPDAILEPDPPCSFTALGAMNCQTQAREWHVRQIVGLWPWAFDLIAGLAGLWLLSVGVLSLRRRALIDQGRLPAPP